MMDSFKKINFLILTSHRNKIILLTFLIFIGMCLEAIGLGAIIPVISNILDPNFVKDNIFISDIINFFGIKSHQETVFFFLLSLVVIYLFKTIYLVFLNFKQNKFLFNLTSYISVRLFDLYMDHSYSFHLKNNSSLLIKNIQVEISNLTVYLMSVLLIIVEVALSISVILTLIYIEPIGAIILGLFFLISSYLYFSFTKNKISYWGVKRENYDKIISKIAFEGIGGIKDLLILGRTNYFKKSFYNNNKKKAKVNTYNSTLNSSGRYFLELISIIGLTGFIFIMLLKSIDMNSIVITLTVFTAASFKMIPSLNRTLSCFQNLKFYKPALDKIYNEFKSSNKTKDYRFIKNPIILNKRVEIKDLSFSYNDEKNNVLENISLKIDRGESIGFIGESGSGKSTLIDLIIGLHQPDIGEILVDGVNIKNNIRSWQNNIGYIPQSIYLTDDSILKNIALGIEESEINLKAVEKAIDSAQLKEFIRSLKKGLKTNAGERGVQLSGGQRQRIGIARALYHDPEILVFDEATSSLDTKTEEGIINSIKFFKRKKTIILISHRISSLIHCDKVYNVLNKRVSINNGLVYK